MSKKMMSILLGPIVAILFLLMSVQVLAATNNLQPEKYTEQEKEIFLQGISLSMLKDEPIQNAILCFDVNDEGCVAIGFQNTNNKTICVYSSDREFMYGYSFSAYGNFSILWKGAEICIIFARGNVAATFNRSGDCTSIERIIDGKINSSFSRADAHGTKKEKNGHLYILENDMVIGNKFSRLIVLHPDGTESVFYDATSKHYRELLPDIICIVGAISYAIWYVSHRSMKHLGSTKKEA